MYRTSTICYLLQHVAAQVAKQSDQVLQEQLGIGFSQFKLLRALQANPQTKQRDIASSLGQTEASISRQVKLMIEQGLLKSIVSPNSHREHVTIVTPKGLRLTDAAIEVLAKFHTPTLAILTDRQQDQLIEMLESVHGIVCNGSHANPVIHKNNVKQETVLWNK